MLSADTASDTTLIALAVSKRLVIGCRAYSRYSFDVWCGIVASYHCNQRIEMTRNLQEVAGRFGLDFCFVRC